MSLKIDYLLCVALFSFVIYVNFVAGRAKKSLPTCSYPISRGLLRQHNIFVLYALIHTHLPNFDDKMLNYSCLSKKGIQRNVKIFVNIHNHGYILCLRSIFWTTVWKPLQSSYLNVKQWIIDVTSVCRTQDLQRDTKHFCSKKCTHDCSRA